MKTLELAHAKALFDYASYRKGAGYLILLYVQEEAKISQNTFFHEQPFSVLPHISYCISRGCRRPAEYQRIALSDMRH